MEPAGADSRHLDHLRTSFNRGEVLKFIFFWGHQERGDAITSACLSQWYPSPFEVDGRSYGTAEHFMMAEKARLFGNVDLLEKILNAPNPAAAKALGRAVRGFDERLWQQNRFSIVVRANRAKFEQNPRLGDYLRGTASRVLVEASSVDRVWGIGLADTDQRCRNPNLWRGLNLLGFALMRVRDVD